MGPIHPHDRSTAASRRARVAFAVVATLVAASTTTLRSPALGDGLTCADFSNQAAAQNAFIAGGGPALDPGGLDPDNDGLACEDLRAPFRGLLTVERLGGEFSGRVVSADPSCLGVRRVTILGAPTGKKKFKRIATASTDADGEYTAEVEVGDGNYYAKIAKRPGCVSERSPTISIPDRRLEISPQGVFFTAPGESETLVATFVDDATGTTTPAPNAWFHSSDPDAIAVTRDGNVTAIAANGSAQITATVEGVNSSSILAVVTTLPDDTETLADEQIVEGPEAEDPEAEPSFDNTFVAVLTGVARPQIGTLYIGVGDIGLVGRVASVTDVPPHSYRVTFSLVPVTEAFPNLTIDQSLDLGNAPVTIAPDIAEQFTVTRQGSQFTFSEHVSGGSSPASAPAAEEKKGPCELSYNVGAGLKFKPVKISFEINPNVDLSVENGVFRHLMIEARPRAIIESGITASAGFAGQVECKVELIKPRFPAPGPLGFVLGVQVPVGMGITVAGKITVAELDVSLKVVHGADLQAGYQCSLVSPCEFIRKLERVEPTWTQEVKGHGLDGPRLEVELSPFLSIAPSIGVHAAEQLQFTVFEAKIGAKLAGTFGTVRDQVLADDYASNYNLIVESSVTIAPQLGEIAKLVNVEGFIGSPLKLPEIELGRSPTGVLTANRQDFKAGDRLKFKLNIFHPRFLGSYNVDEVLLYRHKPGATDVELIERQTASPEQTRFNFFYKVPDSGRIDEFYAFATTPLTFDELELEIARAVGYCGGARTATSPRADACSKWPQTWAGRISGTYQTAPGVDYAQTTTWSGDVTFERDLDDSGDSVSYRPAVGSLTYRTEITDSAGCTGSEEATFTVDRDSTFGVMGVGEGQDDTFTYLGPDGYWECSEGSCHIPRFTVPLTCPEGSSREAYFSADIKFVKGDNQFHEVSPDGTTIAGSATQDHIYWQLTFEWDLRADQPLVPD